MAPLRHELLLVEGDALPDETSSATAGVPATAVDQEAIRHASFSYYPPLSRLRAYVEQHYGSRITLSDAARAAGLERTYLSAFFHRKVGIRFRDWLTLFRVAQAQRLLEQTDIGITQAALAVGFGDLRAFERAFRRVTNVCPATFKRAVRPQPAPQKAQPPTANSQHSPR